MAAALEQYVNNVQTLSSQGNFSPLCEFIGKSVDSLAKNAGHLDNVLATLNIQQHSLGILGILCVKYNLPNIPDFETLFVQTQEFIFSSNGEQVRYATDKFADLCHKFSQNLIDRKQPMRGISVLVRAIQKIQLHPAQLTSIHSDLCQLCLLSKNMKPALQFLNSDITEISKEGGHYDAKDFLLYYYYGGMIYASLKNFARALYFFEVMILLVEEARVPGENHEGAASKYQTLKLKNLAQWLKAITTPSMAVSHIMLEAYKKYILVALILHGKIPNVPKYTSQVVARYIKPLCQPYHDLATSYSSNNPSELRSVVQKHTEAFSRDNNYGLVKQCITSLYKKNIKRLTKTFLTLSLSDMAQRVQLSGPREAEKYVLHMIEDGEIFATINQKDGMVQFNDNTEKYNSSTMLLKIDEEMQNCIQLDEKLREMDREIAVNPQYVQKSSGIHDDDLPGCSIKSAGY